MIELLSAVRLFDSSIRLNRIYSIESVPICSYLYLSVVTQLSCSRTDFNPTLLWLQHRDHLLPSVRRFNSMGSTQSIWLNGFKVFNSKDSTRIRSCSKHLTQTVLNTLKSSIYRHLALLRSTDLFSLNAAIKLNFGHNEPRIRMVDTSPVNKSTQVIEF